VRVALQHTATSTNLMNSQHANFDPEQRRAGIRRTAWIVGGIAFAIFVLFFLEQGVLR